MSEKLDFNSSKILATKRFLLGGKKMKTSTIFSSIDNMEISRQFNDVLNKEAEVRVFNYQAFLF